MTGSGRDDIFSWLFLLYEVVEVSILPSNSDDLVYFSKFRHNYLEQKISSVIEFLVCL